MEKLENLTEKDIKNGVLLRMLESAGIADVQQYVKQFNERIEEYVVEEFQHPNRHTISNNEKMIQPTDIQSWITGFRPYLEESMEQSVGEPQKPQPIDLKSWMQGMVSNDFNTPDNNNNKSEITNNTTNQDTTVTGDLGTWLHDWSKNLTEQPPPKSLDEWLQSLVPENMNEPMEQAKDSKGRLNIYLNAAEKVLSEAGYDVSSKSIPSSNTQTKVGMFGNVKQMYFLWKTLDKNNDRKITVEDVQIMLAEMGLGFLSKYVAKTLFDMVDSNHDGQLQFRDFVALMSIIKKLLSALASAKN